MTTGSTKEKLLGGQVVKLSISDQKSTMIISGLIRLNGKKLRQGPRIELLMEDAPFTSLSAGWISLPHLEADRILIGITCT
jgi:hypothetical protein